MCAPLVWAPPHPLLRKALSHEGRGSEQHSFFCQTPSTQNARVREQRADFAALCSLLLRPCVYPTRTRKPRSS